MHGTETKYTTQFLKKNPETNKHYIIITFSTNMSYDFQQVLDLITAVWFQ